MSGPRYGAGGGLFHEASTRGNFQFLGQRGGSICHCPCVWRELTEEVIEKAFKGGIGSHQGSDGHQPLSLPVLRLHTKSMRSLGVALDPCPSGNKLQVALQTETTEDL